MKAVLLEICSGLDQALARLNCTLLNSAWGMDIGSGCRISLTATLDKTNPRGVHIGAGTDISSRADILAHDSIHLQHVDTRIGERCHIGFGAVIFPGVKVGDGCIVLRRRGCHARRRSRLRRRRQPCQGGRERHPDRKIRRKARRGRCAERSRRQDRRTFVSEGRPCAAERGRQSEAPNQTFI